MGAEQAARAIEELDPELAIDVLRRMNQALVGDIIPKLADEQRKRLVATGPPSLTRQWSLNLGYPDDSVGRLMEPPTAVFRPSQTVGEVVLRVRDLVKKIFITYCFVVDDEGTLLGIVTMRDLLVSDHAERLEDIMLRNAFALRADALVKDAMKEVIMRHFPVYPVVSETGRLLGLVRGQAMFEEHAFEIAAQSGRMVGVDKEERLGTPVMRSLQLRHPWLQLNLLTAFVAAAVVVIFQSTIDQMVILALFLPVLAGQSGNTGCQALAVTLRGMTLGELKSGAEKKLVAKEARLGMMNGGLVGISAGIGMFIVATMQHNPAALPLAGIVTVAMIGSCMVSGIAGATIPLILRRLGFDPATASSIFLTTATDVASMGLFLSMAAALLT
ncbi:MAG: magnesium transporter [Gemmatimonadetes bacterium]|nr:magnesium transporter [Gemmatimonadota bacterium]